MSHTVIHFYLRRRPLPVVKRKSHTWGNLFRFCLVFYFDHMCMCVCVNYLYRKANVFMLWFLNQNSARPAIYSLPNVIKSYSDIVMLSPIGKQHISTHTHIYIDVILNYIHVRVCLHNRLLEKVHLTNVFVCMYIYNLRLLYIYTNIFLFLSLFRIDFFSISRWNNMNLLILIEIYERAFLLNITIM